jgi:predicted transcriptional regulator
MNKILAPGWVKFGVAAFQNLMFMSFLKYIERLQRMDFLISRKATGTPDEFAEKIGLARSSLFQYLQEMKEMGINIRYSNTNRSYYYADQKRLKIIIEEKK